jgi:hypothetical protein
VSRRVSPPAMPSRPSTASRVSAQFARNASHQAALSLVLGVRRNAARRDAGQDAGR